MTEREDIYPSERTLSDADIDAVLDRVFERLRSNVGSGVLSLAWKGMVIALLAIAYFGWKKGV